ncbi:hypothetical protein [uncultured Helicobacter sp.]|uniref:hypothetical protein n=1 Tax=uncultured Helicobacter sp. TaxID=175537 RepID=UPI002629AB18|nr:hypothetical protein [uncultured Helicobacter sp.]
MQIRIFKVFFISILLLVFSGCLSKELPRIQHYELSLDIEVWKQENKRIPKSPLIYQGTEASLKIANRKIAYKTNANTFDYFVKNEWIEPLPLMIDSLVLKVAEYADISLLKSANARTSNFKLQILDFYYDTKREVVVLNLLLAQQDSNHLLTKETKVQKGGFDEIIKAMNQTINSALLDSFALLN